jgi:AcrR family transcriptional regulator
MLDTVLYYLSKVKEKWYSCKRAKGVTKLVKRRGRKAALKTEDIHRAACRTFAKYGYAGATLSQIAEDLGVSKQLLKYHIDSIEDLFHELLSQWTATGQMVTLRALAGDHRGGHRRVLIIAQATFAWMREYPDLAKLTPVFLQAAQLKPKLRATLNKTMDVGRQRLFEILSHGEAIDSKDKRNLKDLSLAIHQQIVGSSLYIIGFDVWTRSAEIERTCLLAIEQLMAPHFKA